MFVRKAVKFLLLGNIICQSVYSQNTDVKTIDDIFAPHILGIAPSDAYVGLCKMPDGELRHYNYGEHSEFSYPCYLSSKDSGMT